MVGIRTSSFTPPSGVNFSAFARRLRKTCLRRFSSVAMSGGTPSAVMISSESPFSSARCRNERSTYSSRSSKPTGLASTTIVPDSIFARSRISLISERRSAPDSWIVRA